MRRFGFGIDACKPRDEPTPQQSKVQLDRLVADAMKADTNGDGTISAEEIRDAAQKQAETANAGWQQNAARFVPMTLDARYGYQSGKWVIQKLVRKVNNEKFLPADDYLPLFQ